MLGEDGAGKPTAEATQHFDPSPSPAAKKGHVMITLKAIQLLKDRGMLPAQLDSPEAQALIVYGNNFADHTDVGWPNARGLPSAPVMNHMSSLIPRDGTAPYASTSDSFQFDAYKAWWDDPTVTTTARASIVWIPGKHDPAGNHVSDSMQLIGSTTVDADVMWDPLASALVCGGEAIGLSECGWVEPGPETKPLGYSLDNLYHYAYGDLKDFGLPYDEKHLALRTYPLELSHIPDYDKDDTHRDVAEKLVARLRNQPLLADADFGAQKYGAILYQLARRFFIGSRQPEPDLAQLIKVGNDIPGWHTGYMRGEGVLSDLSLEYPHTYLGGMPYTCVPPSAEWREQAKAAIQKADAAARAAQSARGSLPTFERVTQAAADEAARAAAPYTDSCAAGKPTWPAWIMSGFQGQDQPPQNEDDLRSLEVARPGRSDRAALIYLGWAVHMMQDSSLPHHVAGWTGQEHAVQDALGDLEFYYRDFSSVTFPEKKCNLPNQGPHIVIPSPLGPATNCTTTQVPHRYATYSKYLVDKTLARDLDELLGPADARKSRSEICRSLGVVDGDGTATNLSYRSVYPLYIANAARAYESRSMYEKVSDSAALEAGAVFVKNAVLGSIKLLLCAPPDSNDPPSTFATGFVWSQSTSGSFVADPSYSFNSSSGALNGTGVDNTITRIDTGTYRVDFPGLGTETGGNVQVTAYGGTSDRCKVGDWTSDGSTLSAVVLCHDTTGTPVDTLFTASYLRLPAPRPGVVANGGYLWANEPTSDFYTPYPTYQWNASGAVNVITRTGVGNYTAAFPGVHLQGGTVQVTAYGWSSDYCKVGSWGTNSVNVTCFDTTGAPIDTPFTLSFSDSSPSGTPSFHYAWANQPETENYTPDTFYQRGHRASSCSWSPASTMTMRRWSPGNYTAMIPVLDPTGSNVKVTAYGGGSETCKVTGWYGAGDGTEVGIACFNAAGEPADAFFNILYSSNEYIIC